MKYKLLKVFGGKIAELQLENGEVVTAVIRDDGKSKPYYVPISTHELQIKDKPLVGTWDDAEGNPQ